MIQLTEKLIPTVAGTAERSSQRIIVVESGGDGGGDDLERVTTCGVAVDVSSQVTEGDVEGVVII